MSEDPSRTVDLWTRTHSGGLLTSASGGTEGAVGCAAALQVLTLSRDAFERLMGPAEQILAEQVKQYDRANIDLVGEFSGNGNPRVSYL